MKLSARLECALINSLMSGTGGLSVGTLEETKGGRLVGWGASQVLNMTPRGALAFGISFPAVNSFCVRRCNGMFFAPMSTKSLFASCLRSSQAENHKARVTPSVYLRLWTAREESERAKRVVKGTTALIGARVKRGKRGMSVTTTSHYRHCEKIQRVNISIRVKRAKTWFHWSEGMSNEYCDCSKESGTCEYELALRLE
jgi:hypothetical protein